ncbi:MAG: hypothetical protein KDI71_23770 [Xanthomonadales bacterium]|nr:hypothetical protein [Xanthomonadales bacterium]
MSLQLSEHLPRVLPSPLDQFLVITEIDDASALVGPLFKRKFGDPPPDFPRHLVAFYRFEDGRHGLLGYSHMRPFGDVYLSGGSCTDGNVYRAMKAEHQHALQQAGGIWFYILKYAFERYQDCCDAFFGHCGDPRALEVALAAGFEQTETEHVIVNWHKQLHPVVKRALTAKVVALGPF